jgi:hypothetical protein
MSNNVFVKDPDVQILIGKASCRCENIKLNITEILRGGDLIHVNQNMDRCQTLPGVITGHEFLYQPTDS